MSKNSLLRRLLFLLFFIVLFVVFAGYNLVNLQIVNAEYYSEQADKRLSGNTPIYAARGEIMDRNGVKLISNSASYIIRINKSNWNENTQNEMILDLVKVVKNYDLDYVSSLPINLVENAYVFTGSTTNILNFVEKKKAPENTQTAHEIMQFLIDRYEVDRNIPHQDMLDICAVRYQMEESSFSLYNDFNFAENVSIEAVTVVREYQSHFQGVNIDVMPIREYQTTYAAHILGRVGPIFKEEYDELKSEGYKMNAIIGKDGMEKVLEPYIRSIDGTRAANLVIDGEIIASGENVDAIPGGNAYLTIDLDLQIAVEESLAYNINAIKESTAVSKKAGYDIGGGAAVVIDVDTGEILALASYPTYNLESFNQDYSTLLEDDLRPMFNRAIAGTYAPGSTYKMVPAVAALQESILTTNTTIKCQGAYRFYDDYQPRCWIFRDYGGTHGNLNVTNAIKHSCNYYFYELGRLLTGSKMEFYAQQLGLGLPTGIELSGESKGIIAGPTSREARGGVWYPGDALAAAIGQSDHLFTPIQLANYTATLANGGTLNQAHLIKQIVSHDYETVILNNQPEPLNVMNITDQNLNSILQGMSDVVNEGGTAASVFRGYPISVAGKTGSAQVGTGSANGLFVSYAPYENPEIAICVVVERAGSGGAVAPIVRDIYDHYFAFN